MKNENHFILLEIGFTIAREFLIKADLLLNLLVLLHFQSIKKIYIKFFISLKYRQRKQQIKSHKAKYVQLHAYWRFALEYK